MSDRPRIPEELRQAHLENVTAVLVFLLFARREHGPSMMYGGRTVQEAITAFGELSGIDIVAAQKKLIG